jgi:hypothetical protein
LVGAVGAGVDECRRPREVEDTALNAGQVLDRLFGDVAAVPARAVSMIGAAPVTVTVSVTVASNSLKSTDRSSPSCTLTPVSVLSRNPLNTAVTEYGPPTRTFSI